MRKKKLKTNFKIGEFVFVSKYSDRDFNDPFAFGPIVEFGVDHKGSFFRIENNQRRYRHAFNATEKECWEYVEAYMANTKHES